MADLHNLLADLDQDDEVYDHQQQQSHDRYDANINDIAYGQPEVPTVLKDAERLKFDATIDKLDIDIVDVEDDIKEDDDYSTLKRLWSQEVHCPELLPHDNEHISLFMELLESQEDSIEQLQAKSSSSSDTNMASLVASIYKMDAARVRFMMTDLGRTRLNKIEKYALHMRDHLEVMSEPEVCVCMCFCTCRFLIKTVLTFMYPQINYLKQYGSLLDRHFSRTVLDHLPKEMWRVLDEPEMIDRPNLDQFVFCRIKETVEIDNFDPLGQEEQDDLNIQEHVVGSCLIARYSAIQDLMFQGKIELVM